MTQRELAEHFGFRNKSVVKEALKRARKKGRNISKIRGCKPAKIPDKYLQGTHPQQPDNTMMLHRLTVKIAVYDDRSEIHLRIGDTPEQSYAR